MVLNSAPIRKVSEITYRGADKSLARPGRKQATAIQRQKILSFIYLIYNHNWRNISTIYIYYNKDVIKRNILTIKQNTSEVGRAKDLSAPLYLGGFAELKKATIIFAMSVCPHGNPRVPLDGFSF
jgi:hypothetical protein